MWTANFGSQAKIAGESRGFSVQKSVEGGIRCSMKSRTAFWGGSISGGRRGGGRRRTVPSLEFCKGAPIAKCPPLKGLLTFKKLMNWDKNDVPWFTKITNKYLPKFTEKYVLVFKIFDFYFCLPFGNYTTRRHLEAVFWHL